MRKLLAFLLPPVMTVCLFLILFNNWSNGLFILVVLIGLNACLFLIRASCADNGPLAWGKAGAMCALGCLVTLLSIELLFPMCMPREHAQIRDLTKGLMGCRESPVTGASVVFVNEGPKASDGAVQSTSGRHRSWHYPGGQFTYYGYDPNLKASYINLFHWNSHGYYDRDYGNARPEGAYRIAVIGDSYVEAVQVPLSRSFHKLIEEALNRNLGASQDKTIQVLAFGNSGSGQVDEHEMLRNQVVNYNPDLIVLALSSNDFCDDDPHLKKELVLASGAITPLVRRLAAHECLASAFAVRRLEDWRRNRITISPELLQWSDEDSPRIEAAWQRTLDHVRLSRDLCRERGIGFLLFYVGCDLEVKYSVDPEGTISRLKAMGGPHRKIRWNLKKSVHRVESFCHENGIPFISLLTPLVEAQRRTGRSVFGDHYTMFGHQVAAQVLSCALASHLQSDDRDTSSFRACLSADFREEPLPIGAVASSTHPASALLVPASSTGMPSR